MNLGRIRVRLTVLFSIFSAVALTLVALVVVNLRADQLRTEAEAGAQAHLRSAVISMTWQQDQDDNPIPEHFWVVSPEGEWFNAPGQTHLEPPLFRISDNAAPGRNGFLEFEQDGSWLAYARWVNGNEVYVVADDIDPLYAAILRTRLRVGLIAFAAFVLSVLIVYRLADWLLRPAHRALLQQRDFVADAAHELRTPLAVMQASASQALTRERSGEEYRDSLHEIRMAAERAGAGVGELLEMARIQMGQTEPRRAPLRLDLLVEEVGGTTRVEGVQVSGSPGDPLVVDADYNLLRQAVSNVTQNAAARAANVTITSYRTEDDWATVEVVDDGPGFDPAVLPHVFERFRSGDERGSLGLGMSIVRTILEAHDGRCEAANRPDGGASVRLLLPVAID